jgi:putative transcriptional regulator
MGIVVNRPLGTTLSALFGQMNKTLGNFAEQQAYFGGPVQTDRGFVLHRPLGSWQSTLALDDETGLTTSKDIILELGTETSPKEVLVSLGYAGWEAGQLERELGQNAWLTMKADMDIIFGTPHEERYDAALKILGIDRSMLSSDVGHA